MIHRNLAEAVIRALEDIFLGQRAADKVIERLLKSNPKWGARDRAFLAENTYEIVRHRRLLAFVSVGEDDDFLGTSKLWKMLGCRQILDQKMNDLPPWSELKDLSLPTIHHRAAQAMQRRKIRFSLPDWLDELGEKELGAVRWERQLTTLQQPASVVLRTNTLKITIEKLQQLLANMGVVTLRVAGAPDALVLQKRFNLFSSEAFQRGFFEVQDAGSQLIAPFLDIKTGMRVIDACAGAGGKTLHLAALMQNKGSLIAMDIEGYKLDELRRRARRAGVNNAEVRLIENTKVIKRLHETADRLLLDAPCSGLGVLRRNPDAKWKLQPDFLEKICHTQREILQNYAKMVRVGGQMVYATCSLLPSENEQQVQFFLSNNKHFGLVKEQNISPADFGFDGFYMACLQRN